MNWSEDREERQKIIRELAAKHLPFSDKPVAGRANTPEQKKQVLERIAVIWEQNPTSRLGQLLMNGYKGDLFVIEDFELLDNMEYHYEQRKGI